MKFVYHLEDEQINKIKDVKTNQIIEYFILSCLFLFYIGINLLSPRTTDDYDFANHLVTHERLSSFMDILDNMVEWDSRYYYLPYNILANLFEISKQYGDAERVYLQLIEVMLVNEYTEDSPTIIQFREKAAELHQLALTT